VTGGRKSTARNGCATKARERHGSEDPPLRKKEKGAGLKPGTTKERERHGSEDPPLQKKEEGAGLKPGTTGREKRQ